MSGDYNFWLSVFLPGVITLISFAAAVGIYIHFSRKIHKIHK